MGEAIRRHQVEQNLSQPKRTGADRLGDRIDMLDADAQALLLGSRTHE